jgi:hypothetical protein
MTNGKIIFGIGCGVITMMIRLFGAYPEGVSFAILIMNILVPHIDKVTRRSMYGTKRSFTLAIGFKGIVKRKANNKGQDGREVGGEA